MTLTDRIPSWKKLSLFAVTWPIFVDSVLRMLLGTVDVFMLSRISDKATGAVGLANEIIYFCILMFGFVGIGTSVAVSQYIGAGREKEASRISALAITMNLVFGILVSLVLVFYGEPLLHLLKLDPEQIGIASHYLKIIGGFMWIEALSYAVSSVIRSSGHTKSVMFVTLGVNIIHVTGNYLLIFGNLGFPEWGVTGAAISTVVSRLLGIVVLFIILYRRVPAPIRGRDYITWNGSYLKQILSVGLPAAGEHLSWQSQYLMIISFVNMIGITALNTHVYVMNVSNYFMALAMAIGAGTEIIVGQMVGAGEMNAAYKRLMKSVRISFVLTLAIVSAAAIFRHGLIGMFTKDPEIIAAGASIFLLSIVLEPGRTFNMVIINSLRAAGDARFPVLMGVLSMWGVSVPLAYALGVHFGMGLLGIWIAFVVDEWLRGVIMLLRWRSRAWEKKALVKPVSVSENGMGAQG
ncbi:MAG: MATE family efflux transporter [Paenibacillus macerans]|uniref:MATE family efflux transporter n=1 Tax=Paenibacillus macerans TaxID=44252 RepID=A0A6N8ELX1_PAEMA|nr:MATE family efflux transporter [Paenibacillus macerans]MBS5910174.1 MATE family efflux transporter [Paenibacillus macerans]MDU7472390.1 MATE family efflux transporter [Paenibacillus macerans]MEC0138835.1 MATE family efflux transporter [Paenibacillus macerans]MEC0331786.1 MATE family efflux transporter [Paenibacillus macerans]MUG20979.1 MATE family efflux transporter [Paenibacillus macerans]